MSTRGRDSRATATNMSRRRTSDNLANEIEAHLELETQRLIEEGDARRPSAPAPAVLSYRVWHTLFEVRPVAGLPIPAAHCGNSRRRNLGAVSPRAQD
jgi:hypothetical protein